MEQTQIQEWIEADSAEGGPVKITRPVAQSPKKSPVWIVPPGLTGYMKVFEAHYTAAKGRPILIVGPTGVGKKLFIHLFKKLYREENKTGPIREVNCSHLDVNLARSELFGYIRGAFTGAIRDTPGFVERADKGALILEEIGELPKPVQAKLLTFIETGGFYRVGDTKTERFVDVQVIGSTNNTEDLREDFRARFLEFEIPPLYERREDILYYLYAKFPDLVKSLTPWEVLALLCYNYPDNVRGVERMGTMVSRRQIVRRLVGENSTDLFKLIDTAIPFPLIRGLWGKLVEMRWVQDGEVTVVHKTNRVNVESLNSFLNQYRVGILDMYSPGYDSKLAFPDLEKHKWNLPFWAEADQKRFDVKIMNFKPFNQAYEGFLVFCGLFFQDVHLNGNVMELNTWTSDSILLPFNPEDSDKRRYWSSFNKLKNPIFEVLSGIKLSKGVKVPIGTLGRRRFLNDLLQKHPSNPFLSPEKKGPQGQIPPEEVKDNVVKIDLTMKYDDVMTHYFKKLLEYVGGNQKKAARLIGMKYTTFRSKLAKMGLLK